MGKNERNIGLNMESEIDKNRGISDLMQKPEVEADCFFKLLDSSIQGLRECRLITTAFELGVFEALKVPLSAETLAEKLGCSPVLMPHFCDALYSLGLLNKFKEGEYREKENPQVEESGSAVYFVSELSATYLLTTSPFSQQHYLAERFRNIELWTRLLQILRKGPDIFEKGPFFGEIIQCMAENARCGMLQETVQIVIEKVDFKNVKKMLDLGGGHGLYAIAFAKLNEDLQAFVFDLPYVTEKTKHFIEKYGGSNVDVIPGDFFKDEIGDGYDLIFSSFNPGGKVPSLIPKIIKALNPGGIFITRQVPDEKMTSNPFLSLDWNLWTFEDLKKGGSGYSFENSIPFSEYIEMFGSYGLEIFQSLEMRGESRIVFARKITSF